MEYAQADTSGGTRLGAVSTTRPPRTMERVGVAADRVSLIAERVAGILARFQGQPAPSGETARAGQIAVSYIGETERLHAGLEVLDRLTTELAEIA
jgi:hypothetical protein